ncbi:MAG: YkgJ family cysteine cluster protein [Trichlorobacter sp.]|jgi:Fe-S-cluster containining protein
MADPLANYHSLVAKVDDLCRGVKDRLDEVITCHAGCSSCCLVITVFPVEAVAMIEAANRLAPEQLKHLKQHLASWSEGQACPLLKDQRCLLYEARPIICRTHGLPILLLEGEQRRIDVCPKNCQGIDHLPGEAVLDLERLNTLLAAVNALYLREFGIRLPERISLATLGEMLP